MASLLRNAAEPYVVLKCDGCDRSLVITNGDLMFAILDFLLRTITKAGWSGVAKDNEGGKTTRYVYRCPHCQKNDQPERSEP